MRATTATLDDRAFQRAIERLESLPIRPTVARQMFAVLADDSDPGPSACLLSPPIPAATATDPGWTLAHSRGMATRSVDITNVLIDLPWWSSTTSPVGADVLTRLWRHSVAVAFAARRLARDANDPDPDRIARVGLLHHLGLWAVAAVDPDRLSSWINADAPGRIDLELRWFDAQITAVGRRLAERWECDPLMIDAAWLHADVAGDLNACAADPTRLALIQSAYAQARRTPWSLDPAPDRDLRPNDPWVRLLTAEVQSRTGSPFVDPDASPREEALTRDNLRLRVALARAEATGTSAARLVATLAEASSVEDPQTWADRAALAWCHEPGVASARLVWRPTDQRETGSARALTRLIETATTPDRPPAAIFPLGDAAQPVADLLIWEGPGGEPFAPSPAILAGWSGWARMVDRRERVVRSLDQAVLGHRGRVARDDSERRRQLLAGLAEFAAGAGHELNNPLAVIMGRAQLLLTRSSDPETTRSLRAIITQAQRAHRILRDLMFVARPSDFRPRACQPDEIVRASLRDLQDEAEAQGVRLLLDVREPAPKVWADPEPLRQVADILTRNALEASASGATIRFSTGGDARQIRWTVHDGGRGIAPADGPHLFDPFFCGRQAGRGLGLGLPRAARIIDLVGGEIRWQSATGQGASFQVTWPVEAIPGPAPNGPAEPEDGSKTG